MAIVNKSVIAMIEEEESDPRDPIWDLTPPRDILLLDGINPALRIARFHCQ